MKQKTNTKPPTETVTRGWKVTDKDMKCKGVQYALGQVHEVTGPLVICNNGIHFCKKLAHCFDYYSFDKKNRVFEIEAYGDLVDGDSGRKHATGKIKFLRELSWTEVLAEANDGADNTGHSNTGDSNTGDRNTGDRNTGYSNTGDWNTGYSNTGDRNTGDRNTGYSNTGDWNTGYSNTGDWNTGYRNTGDRNTGDRNTGYSNTGDRNTGDWNTGDSNTGYSNTGDRNTGVFCTGVPEKIMLFDQPSNMTMKEFEGSDVFLIMRNYCNTKIWIPEHAMTEEEKANNRGWKAAEGYVKDIPFKQAFSDMWHNLSDGYRKKFRDLPNFDAKIFEHITGVKIDG